MFVFNEKIGKNIIVVSKKRANFKSTEFDLEKFLNKFNKEESELACLFSKFYENFDNTWVFNYEKAKNSAAFGANLAKMLLGKKLDEVSIIFDDFSKKEIEEVVLHFLLRNYSFNLYKKDTDEKIMFVKKINIIGPKIDNLDEITFEAESVKKARTFINMPPCDLYPESFAKEVINWLTPLGVKCKLLKGDDIKEMGLLLAVGKASEFPPCMLVLEWVKNENNSTTAIIGKGVTYDTGGLAIKPAGSMEKMKSDMSGAAIVASVMANVAKNNLDKNVVGIMCLAENSISSNAFRNDDIIVSLSKKTVEIKNTDAEGRLILADGITYVQKNYKIEKIVDIATLTGAVVVSLGSTYAGLFSNDDNLVSELIQSGKETKELLWQLPMHENFDESLNSEFADMQNISNNSNGAGSSVAAHFLLKFVEKDVKWAHLDIAGVSFLQTESFSSIKGATGFGIRLLWSWLKLN